AADQHHKEKGRQEESCSCARLYIGFEEVPHVSCLPLLLFELTSLYFLHDVGSEAQLYVVFVTLRSAVRVTDTDHIHALRVFAEEAVLKAEVADKVHLLLNLRATRVFKRGLSGPEHRRSAQLRL